MAVKEVNESNFEEEVLKAKEPVVVDFWAPWCGPCQKMAPVFDELSEEFGAKVKFCKVNVDESQNIANQNNIQGIPCIILFRGNREIGRIVGFEGKETVKQKIESHIADVY
jgi:thioredoxin 1